MRPRAVSALNSRPDDIFLTEISEGLSLIAAHATKLADAAAGLSELGHGRGMGVMELFAAEEAAKYLILIDAVRTPRAPPNLRATQLDHFNQHLAKGVYANVCDARPADFQELLRYIAMMRRQYYLDGPNDVDWIFRNQIAQQREEALYVDYVETDEGHHWVAPHAVRDDPLTTRLFVEPAAVRLVRAMEAVGFSEVAALKVIAARWRAYEVVPDTRYTDLRIRILQTLEEIEALALEARPTVEQRGEIARSWPFPLWGQDLSQIRVDRDDLRTEQEAWTPDW